MKKDPVRRDIIVAGLIVLAFGLGLWLGGVVWRGHHAEELARGQKCLAMMGEASAEYRQLARSVLASADLLMQGHERRAYERLLLESKILQAGHEPGLPGLPEKFTGKGGP